MTDRTLVLGAGIAGLTAAATLARAGQPVTVVEAAATPGGDARSTVHDGTRMNLGAHAMYLRGTAVPLLRRLGVDLAGGRPPAHHARFLLGGELNSPADRRLGGPLRAAMALVRTAAAVRRDDAHDVPWGAWLDDVIGDTPARPLVDALCRVTSYGDLAAVQSSAVLLAQLRAAITVRYLDGGFQRIIDQLTATLYRHGGETLTGTRPQAVLDDGGRKRVVLTDGRELDGHTVIVAVGTPQRATRLLAGTDAGRPGSTLALAAGRAMPARVATLDVVLGRRPAGYRPFVVGVDEPLFLTTASDGAKLGGPSRRTVLHLARYLRLDERSGSGHRARMERLLDQTAPGWRHDVVDARFLPDIAVSSDLVRAGSGGLAGRAPVILPEVGGLLLAGDWVGAEGYLSQASVCSAVAAAEAVLARVHVRRAELVT